MHDRTPALLTWSKKKLQSLHQFSFGRLLSPNKLLGVLFFCWLSIFLFLHDIDTSNWLILFYCIYSALKKLRFFTRRTQRSQSVHGKLVYILNFFLDFSSRSLRPSVKNLPLWLCPLVPLWVFLFYQCNQCNLWFNSSLRDFVVNTFSVSTIYSTTCQLEKTVPIRTPGRLWVNQVFLP